MSVHVCLLIFFVAPIINAMEYNQFSLPQTASENDSTSVKCIVRAQSFEEATEKAAFLQSLTNGKDIGNDEYIHNVKSSLEKLNTLILTPEMKRKSVFAAVASKEPEKVSAALQILEQRGISVASLPENDREELFQKTLHDDLRAKKPNSAEHQLLLTLVTNYAANIKTESDKKEVNYLSELLQRANVANNKVDHPLFADEQENYEALLGMYLFPELQTESEPQDDAMEI